MVLEYPIDGSQRWKIDVVHNRKQPLILNEDSSSKNKTRQKLYCLEVLSSSLLSSLLRSIRQFSASDPYFLITFLLFVKCESG